MKYLIDTDWVADWLAGRPAATTLLARLLLDGYAISIMTYGEVYEGIYFGRNRPAHEAGFRRFLRGVQVLPINRTTARQFAIIRGTLRAQGQLIPQPDILIGATSISYNLILVTRNIRDFQR